MTDGTEVISLRDLGGTDLCPLLAEETLAWRELLDWDFTPSAELVIRFVNLRSLDGHALLVNGEIAGYAYYIVDEQKGLIGDLYVSRHHRSWQREDALLTAVIDSLVERERVRRIESQLMMLTAPLDRHLPYAHRAQVFHRTFMMRAASSAPRLARSPGADRVLLEGWRDERALEAAQIISRAYRGHIDALINDQYETPAGARHFLENIIQYPGCGQFRRDASFLAFDRLHGLPVGVVLSGTVASDVGHITQLCVTPEARGWGIGYELVRAALLALEEAGCERVSLTVTTSNRSAVSLYERMGFHSVRHFGAHVWG
ncbi:MAG: GNAT family N-acetyltransferase [Bryobacterales bacterium]|nr:GNAT family N-acetyltransferase [Bryobacterales bacterium]